MFVLEEVYPLLRVVPLNVQITKSCLVNNVMMEIYPVVMDAVTPVQLNQDGCVLEVVQVLNPLVIRFEEIVKL